MINECNMYCNCVYVFVYIFTVLNIFLKKYKLLKAVQIVSTLIILIIYKIITFGHKTVMKNNKNFLVSYAMYSSHVGTKLHDIHAVVGNVDTCLCLTSQQ